MILSFSYACCPFIYFLWKKCLLGSFAHFKWVEFVAVELYIHQILSILLILYQMYGSEYFLPFRGLPFHTVSWCTKNFNAQKTVRHICLFLSLLSISFFLVSYPKNYCQTQCHEALCVFMQEFYSLGLMFTFNLLILWTEKPGRLQSMGLQESDMT